MLTWMPISAGGSLLRIRYLLYSFASKFFSNSLAASPHKAAAETKLVKLLVMIRSLPMPRNLHNLRGSCVDSGWKTRDIFHGANASRSVVHAHGGYTQSFHCVSVADTATWVDMSRCRFEQRGSLTRKLPLTSDNSNLLINGHLSNCFLSKSICIIP